MGSSFGQIFKLSTFGESHGLMIGGVIDGCPAGLKLDVKAIQEDLDRRKPGQSKITTSRKESDTVQFLSGLFEGITTGAPIGFTIPNSNAKSKDYSNIKDVYRPSHADYTFDQKYGIRDYRGGGRSSARETACRVVAGGIAKQILKYHNIDLLAYVSSVGNIKINSQAEDINTLRKLSNSNIVRCPDNEMAIQMITFIESLKLKGDSVGGQIFCMISGLPAGLGAPVFDKLHADLGKAMLSINAVKGFEYGSGFEGSKMLGSEHNDVFESSSGKVSTLTNHSGGIQGGISNGEMVYFNVAFKPVATILTNQKSINKNKENIELKAKGRHDPCVVPRAVPIVEAMAAIVLVDHYLRNRAVKL
jgi:chorismate synthase